MLCGQSMLRSSAGMSLAVVYLSRKVASAKISLYWKLSASMSPECVWLLQ